MNFVFALCYMALAYMNAKWGNDFNYGLNVGFAFAFLLLTLSAQNQFNMRRVLWEALDSFHDLMTEIRKIDDQKASTKVEPGVAAPPK